MTRRSYTLGLTMLPVAVLLAFLATSGAATYYVRTDGNDSNAGTANTAEGAWLTIAKAESTMTAGDTVYVGPGKFPERVTCSGVSGTPGSPINYVGSPGTNSFMHGWTLSGVSNINVIGFEITNNVRGAFWLDGTTERIGIIDNYIHDTEGEGIQTATVSSVSYITIRGNVFYYVGHPGQLDEAETMIAGTAITPHHWLIEYNIMVRANDWFTSGGSNHVLRNNYMVDHRPEYWSTEAHSDFFQPGSDGQDRGCRHHVYEANWCGDSPTANSHWALWQDNRGGGLKYGDTNILMRGNVGYDIGNAGIGVIATDKVQTYNNTFYNMLNQSEGHVWNWYRTIAQNGGSVGGLLINSVISGYGESTDAIHVDAPDNSVTQSHNWGYEAGSESSYVGTDDPLFMDGANLDFRLQSGSGLRGTGTHITTIASGDGSGTTFDVSDSHRLFDGWGIVEGDVITTGGATTRILAATNFTITVAASVSWTNGQPVYWGSRGAQNDIGAYPFGAAFLTAATIQQNGTTYTVTPTGDARGVWFYVDGIPAIWDYDAPYQQTIASGTVTAKAYALWAQSEPVVVAVEEQGGEGVSETFGVVLGAGVHLRGSMHVR